MNKNIRIIAVVVLLFSITPFGFAKKVAAKEPIKPTISTQDQRKLDYYFFEAVKQRQAGNLDRAIDLLTECYYINAHSAAVLYEFAMIYTNIQDIQRAIKFMSLASREDRSNSWYKMGLAELCIKNNDLTNAILIYKDIAQNHPEADDVDYMLASLYKQTKQFKESLNSLNKVEKKNGINEAISFEKYRLYMELKDKNKANAEIDKLVQKFPLEYRYRILRGDMYLQEDKNPEKALNEYNEIKKTDPNNSMLIIAMYNYYKAIKDTASADESFREAFLNKNVSVDDKMEILTQYLTVENQSVKKAEEYFKLLIDMYPKNEMLRTYYASFLLMQRRYDDAIPELQFMLQLNPKNKEGWLELIKAYSDLDKQEEVISVTDAALKQLPEEASLYLLKGIFLVQKDKKAEALAYCKKGLTVIKPDEDDKKADLYIQIGDIYATDNVLDSAFVYYENAYKLNPNNATLLNNYAYYLCLANKDLSRAEVMSAKTVESYPNNVSFLDTYAWIFFMEGNLTLAQMYIQQAIDKGGDENEVVMEHFGDILFNNGEKEEALKWWEKSKEKGNKSTILQQKIETKSYIPEPKVTK
jgi:predicted Zn-dependent protease